VKPKKAREIDTKKVSGFDVCQTPSHALEPLLPLLKEDWIVWESAVGPERLLRKTLCTHGYNVIGTDLLYGEEFNYFHYDPTFNYDVEVTNVPFSLKYLWIQRAMQRGKPFAFLVPYETGAAGKMQLIAAKYNTVFQILAPERRINYKMPGKGWDSSAQMPTCWITWKLHADSIYRSTMYLETFAVPMRNVKYDEHNQEIVKE
jgi:hypothetical protein